MGLSPKDLAAACQPIVDGVYRLRDPVSGHDHSIEFQMPVPRSLKEYYRIIKRPMALSTIKANLKAHKYTSIHQFLVDMVQIVHNALTFNPPNSYIHQDALVLDRYIQDQLSVLRNTGLFEPQELVYPDLGPIPDFHDDSGVSAAQPSPAAGSNAGDDWSSEEDYHGGSSRRRRPLRKTVLLGRRKREEDEDESTVVSDGRKKRGRPPTVDKPHEHRIKAILRAVRRERDGTGRLLCTEFEKVPAVPTYTQKIAHPIALDTVRKNIKRRGYGSVDEFMRDMNLIFNNAKSFMADDTSLVSQDATHLQHVMAAAAEEELKKPDSAYADPESGGGSKTSRLPLDEIEHRGELYHVGDWVHISNPNDPAKPTVGQVFRMWQENGQKWVNCCWYYRPEQTVHRYDKLFYENEVVKSGQYRDHLIDDILEKCFVMFITKYQRGRPKGIGDRSVYCCESRYNETEKTFNKIRTWKACIPDEVRSTDYPMDLFERARPLKRLVSPLKHTLPSDARDDDEVPEPVKGASNAPPIRGAVYKRPYDPNDPPEQPTPPSPPAAGAAAAAVKTEQRTATRSQSPAVATAAGATRTADVAPAAVPGPPQAAGMNSIAGMPPTPVVVGSGGTSVYARHPNAVLPQHISAPPPTGPQPPPPTAFVLPSQLQERLPAEQLNGLARLQDGELLWFPACPVWVSHRVEVDPLGGQSGLQFDCEGESRSGQRVARGLGHSLKYLAWKAAKKISTA